MICMSGSYKTYNVDFPYTYDFCSTNEINFDESERQNCCDSYGTGTWNQLCGSDSCSLDYEEDEVAGVLLVSI